MQKHIAVMVVGIAISMCSSSAKGENEDKVLEGMRAELQSGITGSDKVEKHEEIVRHLERKLGLLEDMVRMDLGESYSIDAFNEAARLWREYRDAQSFFEGQMYPDEYVRRQIQCGAVEQLTKARMARLITAMGPEILYWEDGQGGWIR